MGTRGLLGLIVRGKRRGTYNQFDSYPEGLGAAIAEFLAALTEEDRLRMIERLDQIEWVSMWDMAPPDAVERYRVEEFDIAPSRDKSTRDYWILHRTLNTTWGQLLSGVQGANLLKPVLEGRLRHLAFDEDGVSCEWVYWVDFENKRFVMEYGPKGQDPVWTFEQMREEGSFWATLVDNKRRRDRRDQEFDARFKVDKSVRWKPDRYKYPDPWVCRDSPRTTQDEEAGGDVNDDDGDSGDEDDDSE